MDSDQKVFIRSQGIGFFGLLFIVLLILKVGAFDTLVVGWSWWLITAPLWGPVCLIFGIIAITLSVLLIIFLIGLLVMAISDHIKDRKANKKTK